jgi:hypothetical protein
MLPQGLGTLDSRIDSKADALRANPRAMQGVQQKANAAASKGTVPPDLLEVLALQKVASEKAMAKNQLALSMEQNPATVAAQLEQNVMSLTKDDLVKQTAGIMGERDKRRKQQMSPAKPPQQGRPAGLPSAPRPPMQMAAKGGIIGYQTGGEVDKIKALVAQRGGRLTQQEMDAIVIASRNNPEVLAFLEQNQGYISQAENAEIDAAAPKQKDTPPAPIVTADIADATAQGIEEEKKAKGIDSIIAGMQQERDDMDAAPTPAPSAGISSAAPTIKKTPVGSTQTLGGTTLFNNQQMNAAQSKAGLPPIGQQSQQGQQGQSGFKVLGKKGAGGLSLDSVMGKDGAGLAAVAPKDVSSTRVSDTLDPAVKENINKRIALDPDKGRKDAQREFDTRYDVEGNKKRREANLKELRDITESDFDPKKRRDRRLSAFLRGVARGGAGLGYGADALAREEDKQRKEFYDRKTKELNLDEANMKATVADLKESDNQSAKIYESLVKDQRDALGLAITLGTSDLQARDREYQQAITANNNTIKNKLEAIKIKGSQDYNKIQAEIKGEMSRANTLSIYNKIGESLEKQAKAIQEMFRAEGGVRLMTAISAVDGGGNVTDEQAELVASYNAKVRNALLDAGIEEKRKRLMADYEALK